MNYRIKVLFSVLSSVMLPAAAQAQSSSFILTLGRDTIAVENFSRTATHLDGELKTKGMGPRLRFSLDLVGGVPTVLHNAAFRGDADSTLFQSAVLTFKGDSVIAEITSGTAAPVTQRIGTQSGAFPFINPSFALIEPIIAHALATRPAETTVPLFTVSGGRTTPLTLKWLGNDSAVATVGGVDMRMKVGPDGSILGASVPSQNLAIIRTASASKLDTPRPDYSAPAGANYTAESVKVPTPAGHTLAGTLTLPKNHKARVPVVVTITGSGLEDRDEALPILAGYRPFKQIAEALAGKGIGVLRYDDRGYGESTGDGGAATSADFAEDTRAVLTYLRKRADVDAGNLFLLGHSEGGLIAPMVAATDPRVRGIVLMAGPSWGGRRILEYQSRYGVDQQVSMSAAARDSAYSRALAGIDSLAQNQPWMRYFIHYDPLPTARQVKAPVLILQGATDRQVAAEQAQELATAIRSGGNRDVTVHVFPGVNHLFLSDPVGSPAGYGSLPYRTVVAVAIDSITKWVVQHVK